MTIKNLLHNAPIPLLEAEVLLTFVLQKNRAYLHTWPDADVDQKHARHFNELVARRVLGEPIAYIIGEKEFWSLNFKVSPAVLIPRSETEIIIEQVLKLNSQSSFQRVLDLGTGSGCIAISLAKAFPICKVIAVDQSPEALQIAKINAQELNVKNLKFYQSNWYNIFEENKNQIYKFDIIVSNPPYVSIQDPHLSRGDCRFEPESALTDFADGLSHYRTIIKGAKQFLAGNGIILLEHGYQQGAAIRDMMHAEGFQQVQTILDLTGHERVTICQKLAYD